jgi:hypothetical protein
MLGCRNAPPSITFTKVPPAGHGGTDVLTPISGRVTGARRGQHILLYARSEKLWWIQPYTASPLTTIQADGTWTSVSHLGAEYAAILVNDGFRPDMIAPLLPSVGLNVAVVAIARGAGTTPPSGKYPPRTIQFSGYEWEVRNVASRNGGKLHDYNPDNVWIDERGSMHLRMSREGRKWQCSEVHVKRSLGYGTYRFYLHDVGKLEPAAMLGIFTWSDEEIEQNHREMDIDFGRWGNPESKNGEYLIQPYYIPANVFAFEAPAGPLTTILHWMPDSASFATIRGRNPKDKPVAAWTFTAGVPTPSGEKTYINLCEFGYARVPMEHGAEVVVDRFEFLP